ncbi:hypothetical protein, partial [Treponema bryantii]|uniref:hypothetical protein n=1 Tax=Treponema bryantii TaxID=163 RepID=UPI001E4533A6
PRKIHQQAKQRDNHNLIFFIPIHNIHIFKENNFKIIHQIPRFENSKSPLKISQKNFKFSPKKPRETQFVKHLFPKKTVI